MLSRTTPTKSGNRKVDPRKWTEAAPEWLQSVALPRAKQGILKAGHFLKLCYVDGMKALVAGKYDKRQACVIIAATVPVILSVFVLFVPLAMFPTPEHRAFYHFADTLANDSVSMIPVLLGAVSTTLGLKVPLT